MYTCSFNIYKLNSKRNFKTQQSSIESHIWRLCLQKKNTRLAYTRILGIMSPAPTHKVQTHRALAMDIRKTTTLRL